MTRDRALAYVNSASDMIRATGNAPRSDVLLALRALTMHYDIEAPPPLSSFMVAWLRKQERPRRR
jgi:hypothetical protein